MATTQERLETDIRSTAADGGANGNGAAQGRKRRFIIPAIAIVVLVLAIVGIRYAVYSAHHVSTDDAQVAGDITTVAPRVKGQIVAVSVHENQAVRKGDVLFRLDDRDYQVAVAQARAALAQAIAAEQAARQGVPLQTALTDAQTAQAQAGVQQAGGQTTVAQARVSSTLAGTQAAHHRVAAAQAQLTAAHAASVKARRDADRARTLVAQGAIASSQFDAATAAADAAAANELAAMHGIDVAQAQEVQADQDYRSAQAALVQARAGEAASAAQLAQAQTGTQTTSIKIAQADTAAAQVKAAQAALASAQLQLSYTTVRAAVDGVVSKKSIEVGDTVSAGQPVMAVASLTGLWAVADLKETQITDVRVGQPAEIKVDAFPGHTFTGKVTSISAATGATFALIPPDNASGNFTKVVQRLPVRIDVNPSSDPDHLLRQGLSVEVSIDTSGR